MANKRTLLLIDDVSAHAKVFREALIDASDGPFDGEWITTLALKAGAKDYLIEATVIHCPVRSATWWGARRQRMRCSQKKLAPKLPWILLGTPS